MRSATEILMIETQKERARCLIEKLWTGEIAALPMAKFTSLTDLHADPLEPEPGAPEGHEDRGLMGAPKTRTRDCKPDAADTASRPSGGQASATRPRRLSTRPPQPLDPEQK